MNQFRFVQTVDRFRQSVVVAVASATDRWFDARFGKPKVIRCDNGPEYLSAAIVTWTQKQGIRLEYIEPGKPQQNAYIERFNRTARYEWLPQYLWEDLEQVREAAADWMWTYNHERPNMALGGFTPKQRLAMAA